MVIGVLLLSASGVAQPSGQTVARCELTGTVDAGSAAYLRDCLTRAHAEGHAALLLRVDTPGGSLESTREMVSALLSSPVPVIAWVGPPGARAGSAGVFVVMAANLATMAPGTNIGAAHPVQSGGGDIPGELGEKVASDAAAFAEAIAAQRGRNVEWAAKAVRQSSSIPAGTAEEWRVVDRVVKTEQEALDWANGREVTIEDGKRVLATANAERVSFDPTLGQRLIHALASPGLAYLLFLLGALGWMVELTHPGLVFPGLVGTVAVVLALMTFSAVSIPTGTVILLVLGVGLIVSELFVGHGLLGAGGAVLLVLAAILGVDRLRGDWHIDSALAVSGWVLVPSALAFLGMAGFLLVRAAQTRRLPQQGGGVGLIGERGRALTDVSSEGGWVFVHGERWQARAKRHLPPGTPVVVKVVSELELEVEEERDGQLDGAGGTVGPNRNRGAAVHLGSADRQ
jgi:membrane-bound serine protease (ClpP class)